MWRCPYCETYNEDTANFCMICGNAKGMAPAPEAAADEPTFKAPEKPAPTPRPRPSNMWDNGEGLGGATDLKTLAAKRAAKEYEKLERDAAIRRKMYDAGEAHDIRASFDSHVEASRAAVANEALKRNVIIGILIALVVFGIIYAVTFMPDNKIPPAGTPITLVNPPVAFYEGPGTRYVCLGTIARGSSLEYLGSIEEDRNKNKWCRVSHNGQIGYIRYERVEFD